MKMYAAVFGVLQGGPK